MAGHLLVAMTQSRVPAPATRKIFPEMTVVDLRLPAQLPGAFAGRPGVTGTNPSSPVLVVGHDEQDAETAIFAACRIYARLVEGMTIPQILACEKDDHAVAMGHLLHCASTKGQLILENPDPNELADWLLMADSEDASYRTNSRHTLILALYASGLIPEDLPIRNLKPAGTSPTAKTFIAMAEEEFEASFIDLSSMSRQKALLEKRFFAVWSMRHCCGYSLAVIGEHFGGRDHTTVLNAIAQAEIRRRDIAVRIKLDMSCDKIDRAGAEQAYGMIRNATKLRLV